MVQSVKKSKFII